MKVNGSVTVFISIILSALIAFSGIIVDLSRLRTAEKHARAAVQLSVQSALTQYHAPLKENYGMMAFGQGQEELEALITDLLEKNLAVENRYMPGYTDLYGFEVKGVKVTPLFNLTEDYVLEQQITQFMKYRAPVSTISNFLGKLKALNSFMAQSGLLNKKMDLEKALQKIREEQVYLRLLLQERISGFSYNRKPGAELEEKFKAIEPLIEEIREKEEPSGELDCSWKRIPEYTVKISEAQEQINSLENGLTSLKSELKNDSGKYEDISRDISSLQDKISTSEKKIEKLKKDIEKEEAKKDPNESVISSKKEEIQALKESIAGYHQQISSLESEKSGLSERIQQTEDQISAKDSEIQTLRKALQSEMAKLQAEVDSCLAVLSGIRQRSGLIQDKVSAAGAVIEKYIQYHEEALKLIAEITKGCEEVQGLTSDINAEISQQSSQSDNAFLTRMKADIKKLVLNADPAVLSSLKTEVEANLSILQPMKTAADEAQTQMASILTKMDQFIAETANIPKKCSPVSREIFNTAIDKAVKDLTSQIEGSIAGYRKPEYSIEPMINQKEKNSFFRWCNQVFGEENETDTSKDKGQQKKLKQNIKEKDEENRKNEQKFNGLDAGMSDKDLEELFSSLPSWRNKDGGYPNVTDSEDFPVSEEEGSLLPETAEKPNTDIEESYGNSLNQNGNFAAKIGDALADAGESLIKSLYVNEFIVSAFKNVNMDTDTRSFILYNSGTKETFYDKAEVEYILFGARKEKTNAALTQTSIFGIRMGLNLLHVYMNSDKTASALAAATAIAGWTGFGVPIVKNLILIGWAAGESWVDVKKINKGEEVAVYKTKDTWETDLESLFAGIADEMIEDSSKWLKKTVGSLVSEADQALQSAVGDMVSSAVHEAFLPIEEAINDFGEATDTADPDTPALQQPGEIGSMEDLELWITDMAKKQFKQARDKAIDWSNTKLEDYKKKITDKILDCLFKSPAYQNFVSQIKGSLNNLIDSGAGQLTDAIQKLGEKVGDTGTQNQLVGTMVSFDYVDYLRLLLFVVPQRTKLLRAADLMQLNIQKTTDNPDFLLSGHHSYVIVEADISMRYLFLPENLLGKDKSQISVRWGYGY